MTSSPVEIQKKHDTPHLPVKIPVSVGSEIGTKYRDVDYKEKERLFLALINDPRYHHQLHGCFECGICTASCPSARFYDYNPRKIAQACARADVELVYELLNDSIWDCSQCYSCNRCPRQNSPGGVVMLMREVAVHNGLRTARAALEGYERVIYKIMTTGTQVTPDMLRPEAFPDWGPEVKRTAESMEDYRNAIPVEALMNTTKTAWAVSEQTILELYLIWQMTGVMDIIETVDENLAVIIEEIMEEKLEEAGYLDD